MPRKKFLITPKKLDWFAFLSIASMSRFVEPGTVPLFYQDYKVLGAVFLYVHQRGEEKLFRWDKIAKLAGVPEYLVKQSVAKLRTYGFFKKEGRRLYLSDESRMMMENALTREIPRPDEEVNEMPIEEDDSPTPGY